MTRDTTPTDRRAYEKPEIGDDWAQAWDDLVEDLDAEALFDEPGEINTNNLSDDAVTAAKIAAAAVESGAIAEDAVGVDELANALGTSETEQIPGTTHFENTEHESVNTDEANLGDGDRIYFGDDNDISMEWDEANNRFVQFWDPDNAQNRLIDIRGSDTVRIFGLEAGSNFDMRGNGIQNLRRNKYIPQDVRNVSSPAQGSTAYHDGSGANTEGPAHYNGADWISTVDGSTIA